MARGDAADPVSQGWRAAQRPGAGTEPRSAQLAPVTPLTDCLGRGARHPDIPTEPQMCHRTCSSPKIPLRRLPEDVHMAAGTCVLRPALFVPAPGPPSPRAVTLDASPRCRRWWQSIAPLLLTLKPLQLHHHEPAFLSAAEGGRRQQKAGGSSSLG